MTSMKKICDPNVARRSKTDLNEVRREVMRHLAQQAGLRPALPDAIQEALYAVVGEMPIVLSRSERQQLLSVVIADVGQHTTATKDTENPCSNQVTKPSQIL